MRSKIFTRTVGYWPLQESSGQALDYSGNENHANSTNVSSYGVSGPVGSNSMSFDGSDDGIKLPSGVIKSSSSDFSVSIWFNPDSVDNGRVVSLRNNTAFLIGVTDTGSIRTRDGGGNFVLSQYTSGSWYNVTVTYNDSQSLMKGYVNGVEKASSSSGMIDDNASNHLGEEINGLNDWYFDGKIAHVRVWDYPLPEASIRALYNASRGGFAESSRKTS